MKYSALLLLFLLSHFVAKADANSNPGMVHLNIGQHKWNSTSPDTSSWTSDTVVFRFYTRPNDAVPAQTITSYLDFNSTPQRGRHIVTNFRSWLKPMIDDTFTGHYKVYMTCSAQKGEWLEVIVNENTQEKLWIKREKFVRFYSWEKMAADHRWLTISVNTPIYEKPDTNSAQVKAEVNCFRIKKVQGNWMKVSTADPELCDGYNKPRLKNVWVKFKTPERLNITVQIW